MLRVQSGQPTCRPHFKQRGERIHGIDSAQILQTPGNGEDPEMRLPQVKHGDAEGEKSD
ncbi:hypothetical protein MHB77_18285 [Paenibacillus sp. FSL K6-3166]|uniref:hypothetical protein n=1 Tax=Paenibacillus sp. FSL K6-3166 TaxID=2921492 RepID=UPI0030FAF42A